jgi:hypothetical protein
LIYVPSQVWCAVAEPMGAGGIRYWAVQGERVAVEWEE